MPSALIDFKEKTDSLPSLKLLGRVTVPRGVIVAAVIRRSVDQTPDVSFLPDPTTYTCAAASIFLSVKIF
jgi:hypothetical protein